MAEITLSRLIMIRPIHSKISFMATFFCLSLFVSFPIADAQTEQLKILVYNRRDMEKIIGKEKHAQLMEIARAQFHKQKH